MTSYKIGDRIRIENRIFEACKSVCDFTCNGEKTNIIFKEINLLLDMKEIDV